MTGAIPMNKETLLRMTKDRRDREIRSIKSWNERVEKGELDRYFEAQGVGRQTIPLPKIGDSGGGQFPPPPPDAIRRLKMNPRERDQFEAVFGPGSAAKVLGR